MSAYIDFVKQYQTQTGCTYHQAMKLASHPYRLHKHTALAQNPRYGSGIADSIWDKRKAVHNILDAVEGGGLKRFKRARQQTVVRVSEPCKVDRKRDFGKLDLFDANRLARVVL